MQYQIRLSAVLLSLWLIACGNGDSSNPEGDGSCAPNPCNDPPAPMCVGEMLATYPAVGICTLKDGEASCDYESTVADCAAEDLHCDEAFESCIECVDSNDCDVGTCVQGVCVASCDDDAAEDDDTPADAVAVDGENIVADRDLCPLDEDWFALDVTQAGTIEVLVEYVPDDTDSDAEITLSLFAPGDLSTPVTSAQGGPAQTLLSADVATEQTGTWYLSLVADTLGLYDILVLFTEDPCAGVTCDEPPAAECSGDDVIGYASPGTCVVITEGPTCQYEPTTTTCSGATPFCLDGACSAFRLAQPTDVIITEMMVAPPSSLPSGDWFELSNVGTEKVTLRGLSLSDFDGNTMVVADDVVLAENEAAVVATSDDSTVNGGVMADVVFPTMALPADVGGIEVSRENVLVDDVYWASSDSWPIVEGVSMSLDPNVDSPLNNDSADVWCASTSEYSVDPSLTGTPGAANESCPN